MKKLLLLLGLAAWTALIVLMPPKTRVESAPAVSPAAPVGLKASSRPAPNPALDASSPRGKVRMVANQSRAEVRQQIEAAAVTYRPEGVKAIRPYLLHPDPEIRGMARDAMVQLGEPDAIPLLRDAALQLKDQREIDSLRDAADLLALPAWSSSEEAATVIAEIMDERGQ